MQMVALSEQNAQAELEHQAFHDTLTGLPNRALFRNRVEHALAGHRRDHLPVAVLFLDIDDFKNVNDSLGHAAGDEVLQEIGRRLEDCMRPVDTAARLGGDEFAILIRDAESELHSVEIAHRVMSALRPRSSSSTARWRSRPASGSPSATSSMISARDAEELLRNADAAMYMAKESGKGDYQVFEPEMHAKALARLELKADLQRALDAGEFTLRYQPIMDLARGDMAGMEALVRWEHPERGTVSPVEFIPLLEDTGLIVAVGRHILREACGWAAHMQRACPREPPLSIAVNVSAFQLQRPEFIDEVRDALAESGIAAASLMLELTESVMMQDMELSLLRLEALRALGVRLAIDDFGTGYSSLNYVRQLPVDILKIDRSFLSDPNPEVAELTAAIVQLARIFKLKAVAEGIETASQLKRLEDINCDYGQGFHFAQPLSGEEILEMAAAPPAIAQPPARARDPAAGVSGPRVNSREPLLWRGCHTAHRSERAHLGGSRCSPRVAAGTPDAAEAADKLPPHEHGTAIGGTRTTARAAGGGPSLPHGPARHLHRQQARPVGADQGRYRGRAAPHRARQAPDSGCVLGLGCRVADVQAVRERAGRERH